MPFTIALAEQGAEGAMKKNAHLRAGLNVYKGALTYGAVGEAQNIPFKTAESVLGIS
jgi:alanine dehydrogenase